MLDRRLRRKGRAMEEEVTLNIKSYKFKPKKPSILKCFVYAFNYRKESKEFSFLTLFFGYRKGKLFVKWVKESKVCLTTTST